MSAEPVPSRARGTLVAQTHLVSSAAPARIASLDALDDPFDWSRLAAEAAAKFGTPCYLSRWRPVQARSKWLERRLPAPTIKSWLSFKTHPVPQLAAAWIGTHRGVEVVSEAEFLAVRALGCPTAQLLVNGVAKHTWLSKYPVPELRVHLDSLQETQGLSSMAAAQRWRIGLRCHMPSERDARDAAFGGQFGLTEHEIAIAHAQLNESGVGVSGLHFHLGQAARGPDAYQRAFEHLVAICRRIGLEPRYIDCGGGIDAAADVDEAIDDLAGAIQWTLRQLPSVTEIWLENGRYLTRSSAVLVVRVLDVKERPECRYAICDGGRTNHALDADNGAHRVLMSPARTGEATLTTLCGPTCMTDDRLARLMLPRTLAPGDLLVWLDAGAYHLPWETRFSHGLCAVVWCDQDERLSLARARETPQQWSDVWTGTN
jgi:diaminopimelate decarboxylase